MTSASLFSQSPRPVPTAASSVPEPETDASSSASQPVGNFLLSAGQAPDVTFESWDFEQERFFFQRYGKRFAFEPASFLCWGQPAETALTDAQLLLTDGSTFNGVPVRTQQKEVSSSSAETTSKASNDSAFPLQEGLEWENSIFGTHFFSLNEIGGILFAGTPAEREPIFQEIQQKKRPEDLLIFRTGERLEGEFLSLANETLRFQTRELSPPGAETFTPPVQILEISLKRLTALLLSTDLRLTDSAFSGAAAHKYFWLGLSDGSLFRMNPSGNRPPFKEIPHDAICYLESPQESQKFFDASLTSAAASIRELKWLDELPPSEVSTGSATGPISPSQWHPAAAASGTHLRSCGKLYRRGIGVSAGITLIWKLDGEFQTFGALPAADDFSQTASAVRFRVFVDQTLGAERIVTPQTPPELLLVPVPNARELRLEVHAVPQSAANSESSASSKTSVPASLPSPALGDWLNAFLAP